MNLSGAEKITKWLGEYLSKEIGLKNRSGEPSLEAAWKQKLEAYYAEIDRQTKEWKEKQNGGQQ